MAASPLRRDGNVRPVLGDNVSAATPNSSAARSSSAAIRIAARSARPRRGARRRSAGRARRQARGPAAQRKQLALADRPRLLRRGPLGGGQRQGVLDPREREACHREHRRGDNGLAARRSAPAPPAPRLPLGDRGLLEMQRRSAIARDRSSPVRTASRASISVVRAPTPARTAARARVVRRVLGGGVSRQRAAPRARPDPRRRDREPLARLRRRGRAGRPRRPRRVTRCQAVRAARRRRRGERPTRARQRALRRPRPARGSSPRRGR